MGKFQRREVGGGLKAPRALGPQEPRARNCVSLIGSAAQKPLAGGA